MCVLTVLETDSVFIKCQQQHNTPPGQEAEVLQQEHQPGSLVADVHHGGELEAERREMGVKNQHLTRFYLILFWGQFDSHHVGQSHIQEEARSDGGYPLFGGEVGGYRQSDVHADERGHGAADV